MANAGSDSAGPDSAYDWEPAGAGVPPPVHHQGPPPGAARTAPPRSLRAVPRHTSPVRPQSRPEGRAPSWLPYLIVLAGAGTGLFCAWQGSRYAGLGTALVGGALLAAAAARLLLPPRYAGLLASRRKAPDVVAFAVFGSAVLALALMLP